MLYGRAKKFVQAYQGYELDELVSVAWLGEPYLCETPKIAQVAIERDLIDYVRVPIRQAPAKKKALAELRYIYKREHYNEGYELVETRDFIDYLMRVAELTSVEKRMLYLYYYKGLQQWKIADILGISRGNVSHALARVINKLKQCKENDYD
jgi:RNA polymerase sigma factor (sigma-70 family)